ncbi:MAG: Crp/Fnr family transcriptional regulator [Acidobacteriota bacterium]|nr:Crp/Fnr family transcriptional regulator [Acidobacteriota bacterium]
MLSHGLLRNHLLAALPRDEYQRLRLGLTPVRLAQGKLLYRAGDFVESAYFPLRGMISLLSITEEGKTTEVGIIGNEGVVGISAVLGIRVTPYQNVVQLPCTALHIKARKLKEEFDKSGRLRDLLLIYTHTLLTQISQSASCNCFHTVEARLCRWLLISRDRAQTNTLYLTQEFLSQMAGVPRTSITAIAGRLQKAGMIRYKRGKIELLDSERLEALSCECYKVISNEMNRFFAA